MCVPRIPWSKPLCSRRALSGRASYLRALGGLQPALLPALASTPEIQASGLSSWEAFVSGRECLSCWLRGEKSGVKGELLLVGERRECDKTSPKILLREPFNSFFRVFSRCRLLISISRHICVSNPGRRGPSGHIRGRWMRTTYRYDPNGSSKDSLRTVLMALLST